MQEGGGRQQANRARAARVKTDQIAPSARHATMMFSGGMPREKRGALAAAATRQRQRRCKGAVNYASTRPQPPRKTEHAQLTRPVTTCVHSHHTDTGRDTAERIMFSAQFAILRLPMTEDTCAISASPLRQPRSRSAACPSSSSFLSIALYRHAASMQMLSSSRPIRPRQPIACVYAAPQRGRKARQMRRCPETGASSRQAPSRPRPSRQAVVFALHAAQPPQA
jgi:hypothetical protein